MNSSQQSKPPKRAKQKLVPTTPFKLKCLEFVEYYMTCFNATQAARKMGYAGSSASSQGWEFLHHEFTQEELKKRYEQHASDNHMTRQEIIMMLHREANDYSKGSSASARVKAQIQLSKIFGMEQNFLNAKVEHTGGVMIVPMAASEEEWLKLASESQQTLIAETLEV